MSGNQHACSASEQSRAQLDHHAEGERVGSSKTPSATSQEPHFDIRLAIDFGTKYTALAYARGGGLGTPIFTVEEFPDDPLPSRNGTQVPTEIAYYKENMGDHDDGKAKLSSLFGYQIQSRHQFPDDDYEELGHVTNAKLIMDKRPHLQHLRKEMMDVLKNLKATKVIQKHEETIYELLVCYLKHAKKFLGRYCGLIPNSNVEVTFCVPVCWNPSANAKMSSLLQEAMKTAKLGISRSGVCNLFMVNEAEAAATHTLTTVEALEHQEVFVLLDCGGGTTDVGVYRIGADKPFRLGDEICQAKGAVCGSVDLNKRFRDFAIDQLKDEQYLTMGGQTTIEQIVDNEMLPYFENWPKRSFALQKFAQPWYSFQLRGMQPAARNNRFLKGYFRVSHEDMRSIFQPSLNTIAALMEDQIRNASNMNVNVNKVVLAGGFSDSPALQEFIAATIDQLNYENGTSIQMIKASPNTAAAGVATGALMRAQDKNNGPARVPRQSIGIYHHVRHEIGGIYSEEVLEQDGWGKCSLDDEWYIKHTIQWVIKKGQGRVEPVHDVEWEEMHYFTRAHARAWPVEFTLFASDECIEDFFTRSHPKNYGKTHIIGKVEFDFLPFRNHIHLTIPQDGTDGEERYEVTVKIKMKVIDKHLEFTAQWSSTDSHQVTLKGHHKPINVVSAFGTGTA